MLTYANIWVCGAMWSNAWSDVEQLVEIFLWATIGLGDQRAAKSDPPPPLQPLSNTFA